MLVFIFISCSEGSDNYFSSGLPIDEMVKLPENSEDDLYYDSDIFYDAATENNDGSIYDDDETQDEDNFVSKSCRINEPGIVLTFDGLFLEGWYKAHKDIFKQNNVETTLYLSQIQKLKADEASLDKILEMSDYGHEMACNTMNNPNLEEYLQTKTMNDYIDEEITPFLQIAEELGIKTNHFAYPGGVGTEEADEALLDIFDSVRYTAGYPSVKNQGFFVYNKKEHVIKAGCIDKVCGSTKEMISDSLERIKRENSVIMFLGHEITSEKEGSHEYYTTYEILEWIVEEAERLDIPFLTVSDTVLKNCEMEEIDTDTLFVDNRNSGEMDGFSWETAFNKLNDAIIYARYHTDITQIWVASGIYSIDRNSSRSGSFFMADDVALFGGFSGDEKEISERDFSKNQTILSGDIGVIGKNSDNTYSVLVGAENSVLDGFTITGGYADGGIGTQKRGGGLYSKDKSLAVRNCIFTGNFAEHYGGAIYSYNSKTEISETIFTSNKVSENQYSSGAALYNRYNSDSKIVNCFFHDNYSSGIGGAVANVDNSEILLINSTLTQNSSSGRGAGIFNAAGCAAEIWNSIIWENKTSADCSEVCYSSDESKPFVSHSCISGGFEGENNIEMDPHLLIKNYDLSMSEYTPEEVKAGGNPEKAPEKDLYGNLRNVSQGYCSMGAVTLGEIDVLFSDFPIEKMRKPNYDVFYTDENLEKLLENKLAMLKLPSWTIPQNISWDEDPYENISWLMYYHSLSWLYGYLRGYDKSLDEEYLHKVKELIISWIKSNHPDIPANFIAWYDHAVSARLDFFLHSYFEYLEEIMNEEEKLLFIFSIKEHSEKLISFINDPSFTGHNHSMFHSLSLLNAYHILNKGFKDIERWREKAVIRIKELFNEMVGDDYFSLEQAMSYHFCAVNLFIDAFISLKNDSEPSKDFDLEEKIEQMIERGLIFLMPDKTMPAFGNTYYGTDYEKVFDIHLAKWISESGELTEKSKFIMSKGGVGVEPSSYYVAEDNGYIMFRPVWSSGEKWNNDTYLFVDMGLSKRHHGHDDSMSYIFYADGRTIITDSGGPYQYKSDLYLNYFSKAVAHNTVIVDKESYKEGHTEILRYGDREKLFFIEGQHSNFKDITHRRMIILLKDTSTLIIFDDIHDSSLKSNRFEKLTHLAPELTLDIVSESINPEGVISEGVISEGEQDIATVSYFINREYEIFKINGYNDENEPYGFVTDKSSSTIPSDTAVIEMNTDSFKVVEVISPSTLGNVVIQDVILNEEHADITLMNKNNSEIITLEFSDEEVPSIKEDD